MIVELRIGFFSTKISTLADIIPNGSTLSDTFLLNLGAVDPITAGRLKANDSQRIERALEVYLLTGKPLSEHFTEQKQAAPLLDLCTVALIPEDRHLLHQQIEKRF